RLEPAQLADAGRRALARRRLALTAQPLGLALLGRHEVAHEHRGGVPARCAQRPEMRARRRILVDVEALRIEARRERLDLVGREGVAAQLGALADPHVVEEPHDAAAPLADGRRPNIRCGVSVITRTPSALNMSKRALTKPISGRLADGRASST